MKKARKIAPNLVSAARSSKLVTKVDKPNEDVVATTSNNEKNSKQDQVMLMVADEVSRDNQATDSVIEPGPSFSRYKSKNKIQPTTSNLSHPGRTFSSASESEDEEATKSPVKKDNVDTTSTSKPSTQKGKRLKKTSDENTPLSIKKAIMKRKLASGDRSKMTMFDLIYTNPADGERPPNASEKLNMRLKPFEVEELSKKSQAGLHAQSTGKGNLDNEGEGSAMPVPQVRLGGDGVIILDEKSLIIDTSETKRNKSKIAQAPIVENLHTNVNYGTWSKKPHARLWSKEETARFYIALQMFGTNFALMQQHFPGRDRDALYRKFKSEERSNLAIVNKMLSTRKPYDPTQFLDELDLEDSSGDETTSKKDASKSTKGKALKNAKERKTLNEESEEGIAPPEKKSRKEKATETESRVSTRGRNTASGSR